jgi:hypothetical protein
MPLNLFDGKVDLMGEFSDPMRLTARKNATFGPAITNASLSR